MEVGPQLPVGRRLTVGNDEGRQPGSSVDRLREHRTLADPGVAAEERSRLARFDPDPVDLHLVVDTALHRHRPIRLVPAQVAGPVDDVIGVVPERVRHEPSRPLVQIAKGADARADEDLPDLARVAHAVRDGVDDQELGCREWVADGLHAGPRRLSQLESGLAMHVSVGP